MDGRMSLKPRTKLSFPGITCQITGVVGRGSNALVYEGTYEDAATHGVHRVLVKELFPYDPTDGIKRVGNEIVCAPASKPLFETHRRSFLHGNEIHLRLLAQNPDSVGGNLNTFPLNGTLYTLLDYSGGRSLEEELCQGACGLRQLARWMMQILLSLELFHRSELLHLDISSDNVLLLGRGERERVMLIDYNTVCAQAELRSGKVRYLSAKAGYTAPEVSNGSAELMGPWTDLFSLACLFYRGLAGATPTPMQLCRKNVPSFEHSPLLVNQSQTVAAQIRTILRRGLAITPQRRYQRCEEMLEDFRELLRRIDGVGVTHAALWEAGQRRMRQMLRQNPSLAYLREEATLYPLCMELEGRQLTCSDWIGELRAGAPVMLEGVGGSGKSTLLMQTALAFSQQYQPTRPAILYIELSALRVGTSVLDAILRLLKYDAGVSNYSSARDALRQLLAEPFRKREGDCPKLIVLLDGLNEYVGSEAELLKEIQELSSLEGLGIALTSRTVPQGIPLVALKLLPLEESAVDAALAKQGLLMPESRDMRELLRLPMMLSLYLRTALEESEQPQCGTQDELIAGYLSALCRKAAENEGVATHYPVETAVRLVLPAIAARLKQSRTPLSGKDLLEVARKCYRVVRSRAMLRAFPEWIGSRQMILGGARDAEAWYGQMVLDILWKQLGLLRRDAENCFNVSHQILGDYLAEQHEINRNKLHKRRARLITLAGSLALLLTLGIVGYWHAFLAPIPYDAQLSSKVYESAVAQYVNAGLLHDTMRGLLSGALSPEECEARLATYGAPLYSSQTLTWRQLAQNHGSRNVIPWSGAPLDVEACETLLCLPQRRQREYAVYLEMVAFARQDERRARDNPGYAPLTTVEQLSAALGAKLDADADESWLMYQRILAPHMEGMAEATAADYRDTLLLTSPAYRERMSGAPSLAFAEAAAQKAQHDAKATLLSLGIGYQYAEELEDAWKYQEELAFCSDMPTRAETDVTGSLLHEMETILDAREQAHAIQASALQAWERFVQTNDYTDLVRAQLAIDAALQSIGGVAVPHLTLADDELMALMALGVETEALEMTYQETEYEISVHIPLTLQKYEAYADMEWIYQGGRERIAADIQWSLEWEAREHEFIRIWVNSLLLPLAQRQEVRTLWQSLPQRWPVIGEPGSVWQDSKEPLDARLNELMSETSGFERLAAESQKMLGQNGHHLWILQNQSAEEQLADLNVLANLPSVYPAPDWMLAEETFISADNEYDGSTAALPRRLFYSCKVESSDDFFDYAEQLIDCGLEVYNAATDENGTAHIELKPPQTACILGLVLEQDNSVLIVVMPEKMALVPYQYYAATQMRGTASESEKKNEK